MLGGLATKLGPSTLSRIYCKKCDEETIHKMGVCGRSWCGNISVSFVPRASDTVIWNGPITPTGNRLNKKGSKGKGKYGLALSHEQRQELRARRLQKNESIAKLAKAYGIGEKTVRRIIGSL